MAKNLIIVESPAKSKTIKKFLGSNYTVVASNGHVRDLPKSQMGVDFDNDFEQKYITIRGKGELLASLRKEVKKADGYYVYNLDNNANKYVKLGESKGNENCKFDIKNIPSASVYKIKVLAYRSFMNKEYLSKKAKEYTFYSNPSKPVLNAFSGGKGVLSMEWDDQDNLAGYDIQYSKNSDFSEYKNEQISDGETRNFQLRI